MTQVGPIDDSFTGWWYKVYVVYVCNMVNNACVEFFTYWADWSSRYFYSIFSYKYISIIGLTNWRFSSTHNKIALNFYFSKCSHICDKNVFVTYLMVTNYPFHIRVLFQKVYETHKLRVAQLVSFIRCL